MESFRLDEIINEYKNPQALLHLITGIGVGIFLGALFPMIVYQGLVFGLILVAVGTFGRYMLKRQ